MEAPQGGFFLSNALKPFKKPALSLDAQVELLISRGMDVPDKDRAKHYLRFIGYYRLSGYFRFFTDPADPAREKFQAGITFEKVLDLYIFDRKLRALLMDAFERIEVAVKAVLSHEGATSKGPFWLCDEANFDRGRHAGIMDDIMEAAGEKDGKPQHLFVKHFHEKYADPLPPSWMVFETLSFGAVSRIFKYSKGEIQSLAAAPFDIHRGVLESWLHALAFGRNVCAHNNRVWNRTFTIKPQIPKKYESAWPKSHDKLYILCCIIHHMLGVIADGSGWSDRLRLLINERGDLPLGAMGFPDDWEKSPFWSF
jgi:abortive infection bacteriophage resistance protein